MDQGNFYKLASAIMCLFALPFDDIIFFIIEFTLSFNSTLYEFIKGILKYLVYPFGLHL